MTTQEHKRIIRLVQAVKSLKWEPEWDDIWQPEDTEALCMHNREVLATHWRKLRITNEGRLRLKLLITKWYVQICHNPRLYIARYNER